MTAPQTINDPADEFYLQDKRSYVGNDMLFWAAHGGYTTDLSKARIFTKAEAIGQHQCRETDIPWPAEYLRQRTRPAVDMQYCKLAEALDGTGIEIIKPRRAEKVVTNCCGCGKFISETQRYLGDCPHCGADNRP